MSYVIYEQGVIRAQLSIVSNPPVAPIDINTDLAPQFWKAAGIQIDAGIFDNSDVGLDLSNLDYMELSLQPSPTSLVPWVTKTVLAEDIESPIDFGSWLNGSAQNASFILTPADTDLGLLAGTSRQFWMTITGFTADGNFIVYGAGYITIFNPGNTLPPGASSGIVSWHAQSSTVGNFNIVPTSIFHTEEVTFRGSADTRNVVLQAPGYPQGSIVRISALFPDLTAGIIINIYSGSLTGDPILTYTTDAYQPNALFELVVDNASAYDVTQAISPAFTPPT